MTTRVLFCDFCNAELAGYGWECPAQSYDYPEPRVGLTGGTVVHGSEGSWLACGECRLYVRDGMREVLVERAVASVIAGLNYDARPDRELRRMLRREIRPLHDQFWRNRSGPPVRVEGAEFEAIRREPAFEKQWRDE